MLIAFGVIHTHGGVIKAYGYMISSAQVFCASTPISMKEPPLNNEADQSRAREVGGNKVPRSVGKRRRVGIESIYMFAHLRHLGVFNSKYSLSSSSPGLRLARMFKHGRSN